VDGDINGGGPGFGIDHNLVLGEVGFGLGDKPLRRGGTAFPAASCSVEPARDGGSSNEGGTQAKE